MMSRPAAHAIALAEVTDAQATDSNTLERVLVGLRRSLDAEVDVPDALFSDHPLYDDLEAAFEEPSTAAPAAGTASRLRHVMARLLIHAPASNVTERAQYLLSQQTPEPDEDRGYTRRLALALLDLLDLVEPYYRPTAR